MNSWGMVLALCVVAVLAWGIHEMSVPEEDGIDSDLSFMESSEDRLRRLVSFSEPKTTSETIESNISTDQVGGDAVDEMLNDLSAGELEKATQYYLDNMVELSPVLDVAKTVISAWVDQGDYRQAVNLLYEQRLFVAFDSEEDWLLYTYEVVQDIESRLTAQQNVSELIEIYQLLTSMHSDHTEYYLRLSHWLIELGDKEGARLALSGAVNDISFADEVAQLESRIAEMDQPKEALVIPLNRVGEQFTVSVLIDELAQAELLIDTGASRTVIKADLAESYGLQLSGYDESLLLTTANGQVQAQTISVNNFALSDVAISVSELLVLPLAELSFGGLLGMDILGRYQFVIDQEQALLYLRPRGAS